MLLQVCASLPPLALMANPPPEQIDNFRVYIKLTLLYVCGMYLWALYNAGTYTTRVWYNFPDSWEILVSLWFEFSLISRRVPFKWPLLCAFYRDGAFALNAWYKIPYFLARYGALLALVVKWGLLVICVRPHITCFFSVILYFSTEPHGCNGGCFCLRVLSVN